jgi:ribosomal-protein-serine acetyltransferase
MTIKINDTLNLELINESHAQAIFNLVNSNRDFLRRWLQFVDYMQTVDFAINFVNKTIQQNKIGYEYAFVIVSNGAVIGRIGIYKIDNQNKIGEIGYWLSENFQGKGIVTNACKTVINFCFENLNLNRIEIKCATENKKSNAIPLQLNFIKEGIIRQGEWLNNQFVDLNLYSILKK